MTKASQNTTKYQISAKSVRGFGSYEHLKFRPTCRLKYRLWRHNVVIVVAIAKGDTFHWVITAKCRVVTSSRDKLLPLPLKCLKVVCLKNVLKDNVSDIYFCLSSFFSAPAMKNRSLRCLDNLNLTLLCTPPPPALNKQKMFQWSLFSICLDDQEPKQSLGYQIFPSNHQWTL